MSTTAEQEYGNWFPSYGDLPMEIILHIFRFLGYSDRQAAAATCRRWHDAKDETEFHARTTVRFSKVGLSDHHTPGREFLNSQLEFRNFCLEEVTIGHMPELMLHIGRTAQSIYFDNVDLNDKQFYAIISHLPRLRELSVSRCAPLFMSGSFLENANCKELTTNLSGIYNLALRDCQYLTDAILVRLTQNIAVLKSLNLSGCPIAFHNAIYKRFYPNDCAASLAPSESVLTFEYIKRVINQHTDNLIELDFSHTLIGKGLLALCNLKLKRLYLSGCRQLVAANIRSFLDSQQQLVELDLSASSSLNNDCLEYLVQTNPQLEVLKISSCLGITNAGAVHLGNLKRLRQLDISSCDGITSDGITKGVAREENTVLRDLNLSYLQICEECVKTVAFNLRELRILNVNHCVDGVTDAAVQCIIQHLRWLRELSLESCIRLTDASLTGINISKLELQRSQKSSMENFYPPLTYTLAERDSLADSQQSMKISLRSKAEEEIVRDAKRKQVMFAAYEMNLIDERDFEGFNIQELRGLRALNLKGCNKISDVSLKYGLRHIELRSLLLSNCQQISLLGMESLVSNCPSIEELDLSDCYNIDDKAIKALTTKLRRLRALHISGCSQLTDHTLDAILINCKCLQTLSVFRCRSMYMDIEERLSTLTTLRNLNMDNMASIDNAEFFRLKKRLDY